VESTLGLLDYFKSNFLRFSWVRASIPTTLDLLSLKSSLQISSMLESFSDSFFESSSVSFTDENLRR